MAQAPELQSETDSCAQHPLLSSPRLISAQVKDFIWIILLRYLILLVHYLGSLDISLLALDSTSAGEAFKCYTVSFKSLKSSIQPSPIFFKVVGFKMFRKVKHPCISTEIH